jgi:hypothetical protein
VKRTHRREVQYGLIKTQIKVLDTQRKAWMVPKLIEMGDFIMNLIEEPQTNRKVKLYTIGAWACFKLPLQVNQNA